MTLWTMVGPPPPPPACQWGHQGSVVAVREEGGMGSLLWSTEHQEGG